MRAERGVIFLIVAAKMLPGKKRRRTVMAAIARFMMTALVLFELGGEEDMFG